LVESALEEDADVLFDAEDRPDSDSESLSATEEVSSTESQAAAVV
jgi:hypothetical protein